MTEVRRERMARTGNGMRRGGLTHMGRGTRDDPLTDDELADWWVRVHQHHAAANAAWQAEVERKLKDARGAYDRAAEQKTGQNKEKKPGGHHKEAATADATTDALTTMAATAPKPFKPIKTSKPKASKGKKPGKPNQTKGMF